MRGIRPPALFELRAHVAACKGWPSAKAGMPWTRTTLPSQGAHCLANRSGSLVRLTFQNGAGVRGDELVIKSPASLSPDQDHVRPILVQADWSAWGDLHSQGCSILSRTGLLFPVNHTPVGDPGLAPGRLGDFKSPGSALPAEASRREWWA